MNAGPADAEGALQRLKMWRDRAAADGQPGADSIRDIHLTMVARSGRRIPSAIAEVLPQSLKSFSDQMARAMVQPARQAPPPAGQPVHSGPVVQGQPPHQAGPRRAPGPQQTAPQQTAPQQAGAPQRAGGPPAQPSAPPQAHPSAPGGAPASAAPQPSAGQQGSAASYGSAVSYGSAGPASAASALAPESEASARPGGGRTGGAQGSGQSAGPTAPAPKETDEQRQARLAVEWDTFAPLDFSEPGGEPGRIQAASAPGGGLRLRWSPPQEEYGHTIYRIVSGDDYSPYDPQNADFVAITGETTCIDDRAFRSAIRHLQVWRNSGSNVEDAKASQPILHAQLPVVAPLSGIDLREDEGRVIGQWSAFPGIKKVQIFRVPIERAQSGLGDPTFQILDKQDNLGGFVDNDADRGRRYVYQFFCEAEYDGVRRLSAPTTRQLIVSAVLEPVTDLEIALDDGAHGAEFDLTWTKPAAGNVLIFRTERPPVAGSDAEAQPEAALPRMGLADENRQVHPIVWDGERAAMRNVPWPRGWVRTYFTPVTVLDGKVQVGRHIPAVRTPRVSDPVVVERTHTQVLKFGWPQGAAEVSVFMGAKGQPAEEVVDRRNRVDISAKDYERLGGIHFANPLPSLGCSLHMVGVSYSAGERIESKPTSVDYPGLLRLSYAVEQRRGLLGRGAPGVQIRIRSERELSPAPPFIVVHNPDRFPLEVSDGSPVDVVLDNGTPMQPVRRFVPDKLTPEWSQQVWQAMPPGPGFIRLFLDLEPERLQTVALLDPDVTQLIMRG